MAFDDLTFRQSALIKKLLEAELSGRYESEFYAIRVMGKGWLIQVEGKVGQKGAEFGDFTEGDLVELGTGHYLTTIKKRSGFAISLSQRAFEQYHLSQAASELARPAGVTAVTDHKEAIDIFVSHSAKDKAVAEALINLLKASLNIPADRIRCTSVDGYKLPVGATTDEQLRQEIYDAKFFLGLITPTSLQSTYVLFELGARWGARLHLAPVLASGTTTAALRAPLSGLNSISCDEPAHIYQLLKDTASILGRQLDDPSSYQKRVDSLVKESKSSRHIVEMPLAVEMTDFFTNLEVKEFRYLDQMLNRKARLSVPVYERSENYITYLADDFYATNLISMLVEYLGVGYNYFDLDRFNDRVAQIFQEKSNVQLQRSNEEYRKAEIAEDPTHELQKYGLISIVRTEYRHTFEFTEKLHRFTYWLEIIGRRVEETSFEYLERKKRSR